METLTHDYFINNKSTLDKTKHYMIDGLDGTPYEIAWFEDDGGWCWVE